MPTYEYHCQSCRKRHEIFQSITAKPLTQCPHCKKPTLKRVLGVGSGFLFKGSGFYITDYRSSNYQEGKKRDEQSKSPPKKESSGGSSCGSGSCASKN